MIARDGELEQITAGFLRSRLVTLTGPGGVGKTTLARAVLAGTSDAGRSGLIAELAPLDDRRFPAAVAGDLGYASVEDLIDNLRRRRDVMVVFDNCEHVLDAAADLVTRLLDRCPDIQILTTSRERLDLPAEILVPIGPLSTAGPYSDARAMFDAVARRHGVDDLGDGAAVSKLVERLDGLPLALELAAARTAAMTPSEIQRHVDVKLDILSRARVRGPQRHRSLQATIAWSYQLLADDERRMLNRLSVIPPPFTQAMALAVGAPYNSDDSDDERNGLDAFMRLIDQSLLTRDTHGRQSWYRMLDTIRVYAAEQLSDDDRADAERRLIDHLEVRTPQLQAEVRKGHPEPLAELGRTFRSRARAIDRLHEQGDIQRCLRLMSGLWWLEDSGHQGEVVEIIERVLDGREPDRENAEAYAVLAVMCRITGRPDDARSLATAVVAVGTGAAKAFAHRTLGLLDRAAGRWSEAQQQFEAGAEVAERAGLTEVALEISMHSALNRWRSGDIDGAVRSIGELRLRSAPYPNVAAWIAVFDTVVHLEFDPARARAIATELATSDAAASDPWVAGWCSVDLAMAELLENGDDGLVEAARHAADGLSRFVDIRNRTDIVVPLLVASACAIRAGRADAGRRIAAEAYHDYPSIVRGRGEYRIVERLGAPDSIDVDHPRMSAAEAIKVLRAIADGDDRHGGDDRDDEGDDDNLVRTDRTGDGDGDGDSNQWRPDGDGWLLVYRGRSCRVRDTKGMANLARLVARPDIEIAAVDLMEAAVVEQAADVIADRTARDAYRDRARELQREVDEASDANDPVRAERAQAELDRLIEELRAAYGLGGSERSTASTAERARSAVRWRIRDAIGRIESVHPALGVHLDRSISTGRFCAYRPAEPTTWQTD